MTQSRRHASIDVHHDGEIERRDFERSADGTPPVRLILDTTADRELVERLIDKALDGVYGKRPPEQPPKISRHPEGLRVPVPQRPRRRKKRRA